jgi:gliding motility-associated-like protein
LSKSLAYIFFAILFWANISLSQNSNNKWYFGNYAGLDFMTNPPTVLTSSVSMFEGGTSIADNAGNLLFYTYYQEIYTATHTVMPNGAGLIGHWSTTQGSLIIKHPGSNSKYVVFTLGPNGNSALYYSIVDMSLAAGAGSVTVKNILVQGSCTEKLTAVKHCNGTDIWVIYHDGIAGGPPSNSTNDFYAVLVTSSGVSTTPVISHIGTPGANMFYGCMKVSPNGKKLLATTPIDTAAMAELYDFNSTTGVLSNLIRLPYQSTSSDSYGCEFSGDGMKVYISLKNTQKIFQWDLCSGNPFSIANSSVIIGTSSLYLGTLQRASDGKIYVSRFSGSHLGVINSPTVAGVSCNYNDQGQSISPNISYWGLPNFMSGGLFTPLGPPSFSYAISNTPACFAATFTPPVISQYTSCTALGFSILGYQWDFGDPVTGTFNNSASFNPTHIYSAPGTYTTQLIIYYSCGGGTDTLRQPVVVTPPGVSINTNSITCANLGTGTISVNLPASFTFTWLPGLQTGSAVAGLSPGTNTIMIDALSGGCAFTHTAFFTPLVPLTGFISGAGSVTCNGAATGTAVVAALAGGSGNQTYLWTNGSVTYTTASTNSLSAGTWTVTVTDMLTGCQMNQLYLVSQPSPVTINLSSSTPSICLGGNIVLTGVSSGGTGTVYTYTWTGGPPANSHTVAETTSGTFIYTLSSEDGNKCLRSNTISVDFINNPVLSLANVTICPMEFGTLIATGATSYTWSNNFVGGILTDNPLVTTQYLVVGSAAGCTAAATAFMVLKPAPFPIVQSNSPRCEGSALNLSAYGGTAFAWSGPNSFNAAAQFPVLNPVSISDAGVYNVTVTAANSCKAITTVTVVVQPAPTLSALGSTVCLGQTLQFTANSNSALSYLWNGPLGFTSNQQNPSVTNPALNSSGNYTVKVIGANNCTNVATAHASVVTAPVLSFALSGTASLCAQALNGSRNTITLTASGASSYTLNTPGNLHIQNCTGAVFGLESVAPFAGVYSYPTATLVGSNGVCSNSTTVTFTIIPNPVVTINSYTPEICIGQNFTYSCQGANSYTWNSNSPGLTTYTGAIAVANPTVNSIYGIIGESFGCKSPTETSTLTVYALPTVSISPQDPNLCLNEKITLTANGSGTDFLWLPDEGLLNNMAQSVIASPVVTKTYTVIASANNCTSSAVTTISVLALPEPIFNISKKEICLNESVTFSGEVFGDSYGISYEYTGPDGIYYQLQNITLTVNRVGYEGMYTLMVTDKNGCKNSTHQILTIHPLPNGSLKGDMEGCVPYCGKFSFSGNTLSTTATWSYDQQSKGGNNFEMCFGQPGIQTISGYFYDAGTGCKNEERFNVTVHEKPEGDFNYEPQQPVEGLDEVQFTNTSHGGKTFNWFFIDNKGYTTKTEHAAYLFQNAGVYPVALLVRNQYGCSDTAVKTIKVEPDFTIYVPNTFTPNEDDKNDVFLPVLRGTKLYTLQIYNRWGTKILETKDPAQGWDGTFQGEPCKQDTYTWIIRTSSLDGQAKEYNGFVLLHR